MISELSSVGRSFFQLHLRWIALFLAVETFFLLATGAAVFGPRGSAFAHGHQTGLLWLAVVPPLVLQVLLALRLGLAFSLKSPSTPAMRLPYPKRAFSGFAFSLLWTNALFLFVPLFPAWSFFYELTTYPIAIALVFMPCLTFQISRRFHSSTSAVTFAVSLTVFALLMSGIAFARFYGGATYPLSDYSPLQVNASVLALALLATLGLDENRKTFGPAYAVILLALVLFLGREAYQHQRFRTTDFFRTTREFAAQTQAQKPACDHFKSEVETLAERALDSRARLFQARAILETYPRAPQAREAVKNAWAGLVNHASDRRSWKILFSTPGCSVISAYSLLKQMIPGIAHAPDLSPTERSLLTSEVQEAVTRLAQESVTVIPALISIELTRAMADQKLLEGIPTEELQALSSRVMEIRKKTQEDQIGFPFLRAPTDARLQAFARRLYDTEIRPTSEQIDAILALQARAKPRKF